MTAKHYKHAAIWTAFLLLALALKGQMVDIHISPSVATETLIYQSLSDEVVISTEDSFPRILDKLVTLDQIRIENAIGKMRITKGGKLLGEFRTLLFWSNDSKPRFNLIYKAGEAAVTYYDHLIVRTNGPSLQMVNRVHVDNYVRGVIHAEAGHLKSLEFFKVQALSARTYAMRQRGRHSKEGFDLCDQTHCQVYRGIPKNNPLADEAAEVTAGKVIVFQDSILIEAVFSANCGGYTANSEDVWVSRLEYLRSVPDYNFCEGFQNHAWHVVIPKMEFLTRLGKYHETEAKSFTVDMDPSGRVRRILINESEKLTISGEELRRLFRLKSSRFLMYDSQSLLFIEGEGFGHGVGMCQDGAFYLSEMGLDCEKIIKHYYQEVQLKDIREVKGM